MESILDAYFRHDPTWAIRHHLDSYRSFIHFKMMDAIQSLNGQMFSETFLSPNGEPSKQVSIYIGGIDGKAIAVRKPTSTPAECRTKMRNYAGEIVADIVVQFRYLTENKTMEKKFDRVRIGMMPVMIGSCACPLENATVQQLFESGESIGDVGGYFVIGGREKVLVSQEEIRTNLMQTRRSPQDGSLIGLIRCTGDSGESKLYPKTTNLIVNLKGEVELRLVRFNGTFVPIHLLFRALGVETDKEIMEIVSLGETGPWAWIREWIRPSLIVTQEGQYSQKGALEVLAATTRYKSTPEILKVLIEDLFPNQGPEFRPKALFLGHLIRQLAMVHKDRAPLTDRDAYERKRIKASGDLMSEQFRNGYDIFRKAALRALRDEYTFGIVLTTGKLEDMVRLDNISTIFQASIIEEYMMRYMKGVIVKEGTAESGKEGVVQELSRTNYLSTLSHLRRVHTPIDESLKLREPRALHLQQYGVMCPFETPDGGHCGLLKNLSMTTEITDGSDRTEVEESLKRLGLIDITSVSPSVMKYSTFVFLNGQLTGVVNDPSALCNGLRLDRRAGLLDQHVSIQWNAPLFEIHIQCNEGRLVRPLLITPFPWGKTVKSDEDIANAVKRLPYQGIKGWDHLVMGFDGRRPWRPQSRQMSEQRRGIVEYLDIDESVENAFIAMSVSEVTSQHTHIEIHPATSFSVVAGLSPFVGHNQPARNIYACGQAKQAIGVYATNFNTRVDAVAYVGWNMQLPIVTTRFAATHRNAYPLLAGGQNLIVAISPALGFNQEDSMVLNKASVERGALRVDVFHGLTTAEENGLQFVNPTKLRADGTYVSGVKRAYYGSLDENGFPSVGTVVGKDDRCALIGRVKDGADATILSDADVFGTVDLVNISGEPGSQRIRARLRQTRSPTLGDKLCSRYAQKGVVGLIVDPCKLPRTASGIVPDIFINPHAIPSRMTVGHLIETVMGKACAFEGVIGDATAFINTDLDPVGKVLLQHGLAPMGDEIMYDSSTGKQIQCPIFLGVTHMCRLKLMSEDKLNARSSVGPRVRRTMQPAAGRAAGGGLRVGEMERDVLCAHGMSAMMRESFMDRSDKYACDVCRKCGGRPNGDVCGSCGSDDIITVEMPYTFNLFRHEMDAIGIKNELLAEPDDSQKNDDFELNDSYEG